LLAYNRSIDEVNDPGLYGLYFDYGSVDKYYNDIRNSAYVKHMAYTYKVLARDGNTVLVRVDQTNKIRGKGTNMSFPTYSEVELVTFGVSDEDKLKILSMDLIKRELIGEPLTVVRDVVGVSEQMLFSEESFSRENRDKITEVLKEFSKIQLAGGISNPEFTTYVDTAVSSDELKIMRDALEAIKADQKVTWISSYIQSSNVYASLKIRELFIGEEVYDTEAVVDLINRSGQWKIISYNRTLKIQLESANVVRTNSLFTTDKDGTITEGGYSEKELTNTVEVDENAEIAPAGTTGTSSDDTNNISSDSDQDVTEDERVEDDTGQVDSDIEHSVPAGDDAVTEEDTGVESTQ
jgi:hypothetical protein